MQPSTPFDLEHLAVHLTMGRERQKQKRKSSFPKVKMKPKSKKLDIKGSQTIASNWYSAHPHSMNLAALYLELTCPYRDRSKTLAQNYRRLGLTPRLQGRSGGTEKGDAPSQDPNLPASRGRDSLSMPDGIPSGHLEAHVERDPDTGAILQVLKPDVHSSRNPLNDLLNELSDEEGEEGMRAKPSTGVLQELELEASRLPKPRTQPVNLWEKEWAEKLVAKYGTDYSRMFRDRRLNPYQRTEADIRKRIARWQGRIGSAT